jgi:hypothetical protein
VLHEFGKSLLISLHYYVLTDVQVLQVLVFCAPFYIFLDQVGKSAAHSFKSDTPLIDAM